MEWRFISSILAVDPDSWNRLCPPDYPFVRHEFLAALEQTGCTTPATGWQPHHLLVTEGTLLIAALPGYLKTHSYGEYVFDWAWADAYRRYGQEYYPKWISAIPFTPCYGSRLLIHKEYSLDSHELDRRELLQQLQQEALRLKLSSWHCLFPTQEESDQWKDAGTLQRLGCQFHWFNRAYRSFDDFLARMNSRKRKNISKERREVIQQGIEFEWLEGAAIQTADWDKFYSLYCTTYLKRSGHQGYLTRTFFHELGARMPDNLLLVSAHKTGHDGSKTTLAAALFLRDQHTLYGRYWGCFDEYQFLHFETCYYQGIDYAIAKGLQRFDGGAQGEHKIQRGFEPVLTYSNHWLRDENFHQAVARALTQEAIGIREYQADAKTYLPFKNSI